MTLLDQWLMKTCQAFIADPLQFSGVSLKQQIKLCFWIEVVVLFIVAMIDAYTKNWINVFLSGICFPVCLYITMYGSNMSMALFTNIYVRLFCISLTIFQATSWKHESSFIIMLKINVLPPSSLVITIEELKRNLTEECKRIDNKSRKIRQA